MTVQPTRDQLRALADAATPGPWEVSGSLVGIGRTKPNIGQTWGPRWRQDIEFICAAREAVPALLDENAALRARIKAVETVIDRADWREAELPDYPVPHGNGRGPALIDTDTIRHALEGDT